MAVNPLSSGSLVKLIASSLPKDAEPQLRSPTEAVAVACHAGMLSVGFKLIGFGEEHRLDTPQTAAEPAELPQEWNAHSHSSMSFRYTHAQSSMQFLLKTSKLGAKTIVYGIGMGDDKTTSFDLTTKDFISESALPASPTKSASPDDASHAIASIFISPSRLSDLGATLRLNIIQKLVPSLQKEGYEETPQQSTSTAPQHQQREPPPHPRAPLHDPLAADPYQPARPHPLADPSVGPRRPPAPDFEPPGFDDPYDLQRGPRGVPRPGLGMPGYGERDLFPPGLGPRDPLGGGGFGGRGGGGMYMDFDDMDPSRRGGANPHAPPGARYDPPGPGEPPIDPLMGDGPLRGGRGGGGGGMGRFGGMGGAPPNPFGGFGGGDFI